MNIINQKIELHQVLQPKSNSAVRNWPTNFMKHNQLRDQKNILKIAN